MLRYYFCFILALAPLGASAEFSGPVRIVDTDTWDVGAVRVRLHGIDAPEAGQPCQRSDGAEWNCGAWATQQTRAQYEGQQAKCEAVTQDHYGRTVARCSVNGVDAGRELVAQGLAFAFRKYSAAYIGTEQAAIAQERGIHEARVDPPWVYRASQRAPQRDRTCQIKGNISSSGERIFHVPGQQFYARTRISEQKGERWFCTAAEARRKGWRAAHR
ncbi:thermonuclease family protein [Phaeobacter gallaeciensis]|uniref:Thermonuclease family protein n=2 Tax=Roseobacteraceae TaxID=2854170 RepID=A0A366X636_9RHOB|nr:MULTISPECIES: thermonuclease family protein [Roseobacteraceae]MBT3139434.1 thermonuclease family protein [Falsiruegeria litorea]MBT8166978.1 thermonuclease family protein [Falsiruegeria litorea]RBW57330.1 thermonuclease family protein [Phaeobacter gallaeciensis]